MKQFPNTELSDVKVLESAGWEKRGELWISPYTRNPQSFLTACQIEQIEAADRE